MVKPVMLKWLTLILVIPMWVYFVFMAFIRWTFLNAYAIASLLVIILSFFVDIIINTRNAIWDYLIAPIAEIVGFLW